MKKSILLTLCFSLAAVTALLVAGCGDDKGTEFGSEKWQGDVNEFLLECCAREYGTLVDDRDGRTYKTTVIGGTTWMAANLNYETSDSWCYDNKTSNCRTYGRLYTWDEAMWACPTGWHLSTEEEWKALIEKAGSGACKKLRSSSGWGNWNSDNGTDIYGFSALPGGYYSSNGFSSSGKEGYWWTDDGGKVWMDKNYSDVSIYSGSFAGYYADYAYSVRCVKD